MPVNLAWAVGRSLIRLLNSIEGQALQSTQPATNFALSSNDTQKQNTLVQSTLWEFAES